MNEGETIVVYTGGDIGGFESDLDGARDAVYDVDVRDLDLCVYGEAGGGNIGFRVCGKNNGSGYCRGLSLV